MGRRVGEVQHLDPVVGEIEAREGHERLQILNRVDLIVGEVEHRQAGCGGERVSTVSSSPLALPQPPLPTWVYINAFH